MPAKCSSCGAEIVWAKTDSGKSMPLSIKSHEKRFVLRDPAGGEASTRMVETYLSHFADCPNAAQHRKEKTS